MPGAYHHPAVPASFLMSPNDTAVAERVFGHTQRQLVRLGLAARRSRLLGLRYLATNSARFMTPVGGVD